MQELIERHLGQDGSAGPASAGTWDSEEIRRFQALLRQVREELGYSPRLLEQELGYYSDGKYVRMLEGQWPSIPLRTPSRRFLERLQGWLLAGPEPLPPWSPLISLRCEQAASLRQGTYVLVLGGLFSQNGRKGRTDVQVHASAIQ